MACKLICRYARTILSDMLINDVISTEVGRAIAPYLENKDLSAPLKIINGANQRLTIMRMIF